MTSINVDIIIDKKDQFRYTNYQNIDHISVESTPYGKDDYRYVVALFQNNVEKGIIFIDKPIKDKVIELSAFLASVLQIDFIHYSKSLIVEVGEKEICFTWKLAKEYKVTKLAYFDLKVENPLVKSKETKVYLDADQAVRKFILNLKEGDNGEE